jgi:hypothetical protein
LGFSGLSYGIVRGTTVLQTRIRTIAFSGLSVSSLILRTGRPLYNERMSDEEVILEEAVDNLRESVQRLRATQSRLRSTGLDENPNYRDLSHRVRSALAMTEAAFMEARRRAEREGNR